GHDTVTTTIKWALYLIGHHPEVQQKIHQEVDSLLEGDAQRPLSVDDLNDLKYLDCVLKECNRLYPSVPLFGRHIYEETKICGYTTPKGTSAIVMTYFLHRDEDVFPDPRNSIRKGFFQKTKIRFLSLLTFLLELELELYRTVVRRDGGEDHGVSHFEKLLHSLSDSRDKVLPVMNLTLQSSQPFRIRFRQRHNNNK
ncbi:cytochrome P450 4V2, partial [Caerostris extrusa]